MMVPVLLSRRVARFLSICLPPALLVAATTVGGAVFLLTGLGGFVPVQAEAPAGNAPEGVVLAEATLADEDASQRYADTRYIWLGRYDLELEIAGRLPAEATVEALCGCKDDQRSASLEFDGQKRTLEFFGYDGFRWQPLVSLPANRELPCTLKLTRAGGREAFFAAVRVVSPEGTPGMVSINVRRRAVPQPPPGPVDGGFAAAYPEMQALWDGQLPLQSPACDDPRLEAAFEQAEANGRLMNEMLFRCRKFVDGWLAHADPQTGLIPRNLTRDTDIWNGKDSAADNYPFMVLTAALTDRDLFHGRMLDMLHTEARLTSRVGALVDVYSFSKEGFARESVDLNAVIFDSSEYVKDGLLPLSEWLGQSPWLDRMLAIQDDIWKHAPVDTPFGKLPSTNVEINGEQLQVLARIYWLTGEEKYLRWAQRLGDYYLLGDQHPTDDFTSLRLRDHGCEIVSGLCELYVTCAFAAPDKREEYRRPVHRMCERILQIGRDDRGMLYNTIHPQTGEHASGICDTWGYNYNGIYAVYMVDHRCEYREAVRHALSNLYEEMTDYHWGSADEYADSIEGALNLYNREPVEEAARWMDSEIHDMWKPQRPDGVIEGWHGDGNSARTAIMYQFWKTQGLRIEPWREDIRLGAVLHDGKLLVSAASSEPWQGRIIFDKPRHKTVFGLPIDYPRINQFPEWFTVSDAEQLVIRPAKGEVIRASGERATSEGVPLKLEPAVEVRWVIEKVESGP